jgi:hypothetical protein
MDTASSSEIQFVTPTGVRPLASVLKILALLDHLEK